MSSTREVIISRSTGRCWRRGRRTRASNPKTDRPEPPPAGRNAEVSFHGERRSNETHESTTDPEARMARKSNATAAKLCYTGHLLMEHRNALLVDIELTEATGYAERDTALEMLRPTPGHETATDGRRRQGLRHQRVRRRCPRPRASRRTSRRTRPVNAPRSTGAPPDIPDTPRVNGSGNGSRNPSAGSRPSPAAANSATSADNATEPGSS